jgi:hypothetical protein
MPAAPLLELSTLAPERPFIVIDENRYELAMAEDLGLVEVAEMTRAEKEVAELQASDLDDLTAPKRAAELLLQMTRRILRAPDEVIVRLTDFQRLAVCNAFTRSVRGTTPAPNRARRRTGARSSRTSAPSTAPTTG